MKRKQRVCDNCGSTYWRSNRVRVWTERNPGHRDGWQKMERKLCCNCVNEGQARRTASFLGLRIIPINRRKAS
jgi:hypothetical protein